MSSGKILKKINYSIKRELFLKRNYLYKNIFYMPVISCLESVSRSRRNEQLIRSDYTRDNQYSATHKDALADGDTKGRGVGVGTETPLPNCNGTIGAIGYYNFITDPASGAGTSVDNETRNTAIVRSLYGPDNQYSAASISTTQNQLEGQYVVG